MANAMPYRGLRRPRRLLHGLRMRSRPEAANWCASAWCKRAEAHARAPRRAACTSARTHHGPCDEGRDRPRSAVARHAICGALAAMEADRLRRDPASSQCRHGGSSLQGVARQCGASPNDHLRLGCDPKLRRSRVWHRCARAPRAASCTLRAQRPRFSDATRLTARNRDSMRR